MKNENYPIKTVGEDAFYSNYIGPIITLFQYLKIRQKIKNSPTVKISTIQVSDIILDACMQFQNYPIKIVGRDAFYSHYILYHYFKISKNRQKSKSSSMVKKKNTSQMSDIILDACMKFEDYPIKTVGGDAFYSHCILYHYFKVSKNRQKFKNSSMVKKKSTSQMSDIILDACMKCKNYPIKTVGGDAFYSHYIL